MKGKTSKRPMTYIANSILSLVVVSLTSHIEQAIYKEIIMAPKSPIQHVVIIVKENHAFDNYFGQFPGCEGDATLAPCPDPPDVSPRHDHQAWLERANQAVHKEYASGNI